MKCLRKGFWICFFPKTKLWIRPSPFWVNFCNKILYKGGNLVPLRLSPPTISSKKGKKLANFFQSVWWEYADGDPLFITLFSFFFYYWWSSLKMKHYLFNSIPMVLLENQVRGLYQVQPQQRLAKVAVINPKKTLQSKPFLIRSPADILMHFYWV